METLNHNKTHLYPMLIRVDKFVLSITGLFDNVWTFVAAIALSIAAFFSPAKLNFYTVGALVALDIFTAFVAVYMQHKKQSHGVIEALVKTTNSWTSKRAFDSVPKLIWYGSLIVVSFLMGCIFDSGLKGANLATGIIAYIEIRSILENGDKAFGTNTLQLVADYLNKLLPKK